MTDKPQAPDAAPFSELARRLAHDVKNALAGVAGVVEILGRDLPAASPGRELLPEVKQEMARIEALLAEFVEHARARERGALK